MGCIMKIKCLNNNDGFTLVEIVMTIAILGIVISPLMSMFIYSQKINNRSLDEFDSLQQAISYMEEIKSLSEINTDEYTYNSQSGAYEKIITQTDLEYGTQIIIIPDESNILYNIEIEIYDDGEIINTLSGSKILH